MRIRAPHAMCAIALSLTLGASDAFAQQGPPQGPQGRPQGFQRPSADDLMKRLDKNGDGFITKDELQQPEQQDPNQDPNQRRRGRRGGGRGGFLGADLIAQADKDKDEKVSKDELTAYLEMDPMERQFKAMDKDGNGALEGAEIDEARRPETIKECDENKDGKVTLEEYKKGMEARRGQRQRRGGGGPRGGDPNQPNPQDPPGQPI